MLKSKKKGNGFVWYLCCIAIAIAAFLIAVKLLAVSNYVVVQVQGPSMLDTLYGGTQTDEHTYEGGDRLYVRRTNEAERGDIVIIDVSENPAFPDDKIIKRLIATEGDSIYAEDGVVYLKKAGTDAFEPLAEPYVKPYSYDPNYKIAFDEVTLGEGEIFVMGDNRQVSADSRALSVPLRVEDIFGVVADWNLEPADWWAEAAEAFLVRMFLETGR